MPSKSNYRVLEQETDRVVIQDDCEKWGGMSITNDAENVTAALYNEYGDKRFLYYDTGYELTELKHDKGIFTAFGLYAGHE